MDRLCDMGLLANKVAIVTGGLQGIGKAICTQYAKEGASVIIVNSHYPEKGVAIAQSIQQERGRAKAIVPAVETSGFCSKIV